MVKSEQLLLCLFSLYLPVLFTTAITACFASIESKLPEICRVSGWSNWIENTRQLNDRRLEWKNCLQSNTDLKNCQFLSLNITIAETDCHIQAASCQIFQYLPVLRTVLITVFLISRYKVGDSFIHMLRSTSRTHGPIRDLHVLLCFAAI